MSEELGVKASDLNPAQKMAYIEHQIFEARKGTIDAIECPYCGFVLPIGVQSLCCDLMGDAVAGVLFKIECQEQLDQAARIMEGAEAQHSVLIN